MNQTTASATPLSFVGKILLTMTEEQRESWRRTIIACTNTTYEFEPYTTYCDIKTDIVCWPPTKGGSTAEAQCFEHQFTNTKNKARRFCFQNGTWSKAYYLDCFKQDLSKADVLAESRSISVLVFDIGYSLTCVTLIIAISLFFYFKTLRCLRNLIHCNLMIAMLVSSILYLISSFTRMKLDSVSYYGCRAFVFFMIFFNTAVYFWMFVEGVYLFCSVVWALQSYMMRLWHFVIFGWGSPFLVTSIYAVLKAHHDTDNICWLPSPKSKNTITIYTIVAFTCLTLLVINVIIVAIVVWILCHKLRESTSIETQQFRKATRAIVILLPLLGLHLILTYPLEFLSSTVEVFLSVTRNFLQGIQGILVATFYCFLNNEVQEAIRLRVFVYQEKRSLYASLTNILSSRRSNHSSSALRNSYENAKSTLPVKNEGAESPRPLPTSSDSRKASFIWSETSV
ncbi:corticotropin-releasing factor receptor 1-like isoform X3 [Biomphalaria glabrata]|uniref:Corticotropin-releasing factor receptor 1-like isoform X3 n=1 Tax=Biomphalaria glabrata TaxID=6526 RepID=A0A9W2YCK9_BIOGL|nr:corticotropin-releasing factor receptor 1-like isoform X3 [Biomphalaria glabrata]